MLFDILFTRTMRAERSRQGSWRLIWQQRLDRLDALLAEMSVAKTSKRRTTI